MNWQDGYQLTIHWLKQLMINLLRCLTCILFCGRANNISDPPPLFYTLKYNLFTCNSGNDSCLSG